MAELYREGRYCEEESKEWHALFTRHQHEKSVAETLASKGFQVYLPLYTSLRLWKDRRKQLALPLFPCYVFIKDASARRMEVLTTPGVCYVLSTNRQPVAISPLELDQVRKALDSSHRVEPYPFLTVGDRVRIRVGPLEGLEGLLVRKKGMDRLVLSLELLSRSASVEVDVSTVEPVADAHKRMAPVGFPGPVFPRTPLAQAVTSKNK
jgi:transcription antitermination factor NusG